jgi:hypothetical protein
MATFSKQKLSQSSNGRQIVVDTTSRTTARLVHTSVSGTTNLDEIWIYATNVSASDAVLTICWGGTTADTDEMHVTIPSKQGRELVIDGKLLQNSLQVRAYASVVSVINLDGFVNRITS